MPFKHPWGEALVGEVADVVVGGTPSTAEPSLWNGEVRWMVSGDVHQRHIFDVPGRISEAGLRWSNAAKVEPKAVAMALAGQGKTRGTVALTHVPICTNQSIALIKPKDERLDPEFLYQSLIPRYEEMRARSAGGGRAGLTKWILEQLPLQLPPPTEQRRIAEILSTLDEAIEQTEALIAKYRQIKAGLMHDLFTRGVTPNGRLRPARAQAPHLYKESPIGWIPKEWEVNRLGAILKQCGGYLQTGPFGSQLHAHEYEHEGVPVVMPQDINDGVISTDQIARIVERKAEELSRHRMRVGDMVIARRGELSRAAAIAESHEGWLCGTGCFLLRLGRSALHVDFAACVYRHDLIQRQIAGMAVGTTMPSLNNTVMERLFFPFCDPEEQSRITERLDNLDQFLRFVQCQAANLRQQKQGLMHDLLTGRVRVPVGEAEETL